MFNAYEKNGTHRIVEESDLTPYAKKKSDTLDSMTATNLTINSGIFKGDINTSKNAYIGSYLYLGDQQSWNYKFIQFHPNTFIEGSNGLLGLYIRGVNNAHSSIDLEGSRIRIECTNDLEISSGSTRFRSGVYLNNNLYKDDLLIIDENKTSGALSFGYGYFANHKIVHVYGAPLVLESSDHVYLKTNGGTDVDYFRETSGSYRTVLRPASNGGAYLGTASYCWNTVFYSAALTKSDLKDKDVIKDFDFKTKDFIMALEPIAYHLKSEGSNGERVHIGLGAQTLAKHIKDLNLGDLSMVQACIIDGDEERPYHGEKIDDEKLSWSINYTELIPYLVLMTQSHEKELKAKDKIIDEQQKQIQKLQEDIDLIKKSLGL